MIDLFHENDERPDIVIAEAGPGIMALELVDKPAGVINTDIELIAGMPQKSPRQFAQLARGGAGQLAQLSGSSAINNALFQINPDLGIRAFEQTLNLGEERFVHDNNDGASSSSRWSKRSESSFSATRTS